MFKTIKDERGIYSYYPSTTQDHTPNLCYFLFLGDDF